MSPGPADFPRARRIRRTRDYRRLSRLGERRAGSGFLLITAPAEGPMARLGVTVSRKVGNAVVRNRVKRRIREWFRRDAAARASGRDLLVIARPAAALLGGRECAGELARLAGDAR